MARHREYSRGDSDERPMTMTMVIGVGISFAAFILLTAFAVANGIWQTIVVRNQLTEIDRRLHEKTGLATQIQLAGYHRTDSLYAMLLTEDPFDRDEYFLRFNRATFDVGNSRNKLLETGLDDVERANYDRQTGLIERIEHVHDRIIDLMAADRMQQARELMRREAIPLQAEFNRTLEVMRTLQMQLARRAEEKAQSAYRRALGISSISGALVIGLGIALAFIMFKRVRRQANEILVTIDDLETARSELKYRASHDSLTGLPNRETFRSTLGRALSSAAKQDGHVGILFIDLDYFKRVNDRHGHHTGDLLLKAVARRLRKSARETDLVARLSGDEFAIILRYVPSIEICKRLATNVLRSLAQPFGLQGVNLHITASIGISIFPDSGKTVDELVKKADTAMYEAKRRGRAGYGLGV